jgi:RNA polymerase sigma factor (sigma-70 family)
MVSTAGCDPATASETVNQHQLIQRAQDGDQAAFGALVTGSIARLDAAARLIVRDPELARDVVQDALVSAWRDLPTLREPDRFEAWLHRLTVNRCLDLLRRRRRRVIEVALTPVHAPSQDDVSGSVIDRERLDHALARLTPDLRAVVVLRYFVDMPLAEIAEVMGIPPGTVRSRLHRAMGGLRSALVAEDEADLEILPLPGGPA